MRGFRGAHPLVDLIAAKVQNTRPLINRESLIARSEPVLKTFTSAIALTKSFVVLDRR